MNRRIRNKSYGEAQIRDILRPGKTQAGTRDTEAEIRDVPGNTGLLASLPPVDLSVGDIRLQIAAEWLHSVTVTMESL